MPEDRIFIQCYQMSSEELADLRQWLQEREGVEEAFILQHRVAPGVLEFQTVGVKVAEIVAAWAAGKVLEFAYVEVKKWLKNRNKEPYLITLSLGFGGEVREIGRAAKRKTRRVPKIEASASRAKTANTKAATSSKRPKPRKR